MSSTPPKSNSPKGDYSPVISPSMLALSDYDDDCSTENSRTDASGTSIPNYIQDDQESSLGYQSLEEYSYPHLYNTYWSSPYIVDRVPVSPTLTVVDGCYFDSLAYSPVPSISLEDFEDVSEENFFVDHDRDTKISDEDNSDNASIATTVPDVFNETEPDHPEKSRSSSPLAGESQIKDQATQTSVHMCQCTCGNVKCASRRIHDIKLTQIHRHKRFLQRYYTFPGVPMNHPYRRLQSRMSPFAYRGSSKLSDKTQK
ncbi:hypothetical protein K501DRAFT_332167 [Backusella circina FSU 941]|nr:hypothetical protein K501DRAFT_332167 [Backusella circina FSU 941]